MKKGTSSREADDPAELVIRIGQGDAVAESRLVEHFHRGLRLMLRRMVGDPALVDDLVQETFALVIDKARKSEIHKPDRIAGFLRSTARNLLIADRRKEKRYTLVDDGEVMDVLLRNERAAREAEEPQLSGILRDEEASAVRDLIEELRFDRDRELLVRFYLSEDDKERICGDLDLDPGHFRRVLFRARERLRELWERREKRGRLVPGEAA